MGEFAKATSAVGEGVFWSVIDGDDANRILKAYPSAFKKPKRNKKVRPRGAWCVRRAGAVARAHEGREARRRAAPTVPGRARLPARCGGRCGARPRRILARPPTQPRSPPPPE